MVSGRVLTSHGQEQLSPARFRPRLTPGHWRGAGRTASPGSSRIGPPGRRRLVRRPQLNKTILRRNKQNT